MRPERRPWRRRVALGVLVVGTSAAVVADIGGGTRQALPPVADTALTPDAHDHAAAAHKASTPVDPTADIDPLPGGSGAPAPAVPRKTLPQFAQVEGVPRPVLRSPAVTAPPVPALRPLSAIEEDDPGAQEAPVPTLRPRAVVAPPVPARRPPETMAAKEDVLPDPPLPAPPPSPVTAPRSPGTVAGEDEAPPRPVVEPDRSSDADAATARAAPPAADEAAPRVRAVRTQEPPAIDGVLDEAAWRDAAVIGRMTQVEPVEGAPPSEPTEVRILYDDDNLYVGIRAFDSRPEAILARDMERDSKFRSDDHVAMIFDTFGDRRNAFLFRVNPRGARADGLVENSREVGDDWDGIWYADARIDQEGWVAEIALPFKTVTFDEDRGDWGFNIERVIRRNNETVRWTAANQDRDLTAIAEAGVIEGLVGIRKGIGIDVKPAQVVRYIEETDGDRSFEGDPSVDLFYRFTPSLTGVLTVNTDFAETEVDERRINLSRFELFFPEKRDFFLQDAGIFEFGNLDRNGRPFHSRRIGLDEDEEVVDILAGGKVTGRIGPVNLGVLDVGTDETNGLDKKNLFVGRASLNVLEQSTAGVIVTDGNPVGDESNTLVGTDFNFRTDEFLEDQPLRGTVWLQRSFTEGRSGRQWAYGGDIEYPSDNLSLLLGFAEFQDNFRPALGFLNRRDIREYTASARYRNRLPPRQFIRKIDTGVESVLITDAVDNTLETTELKVDLIKAETDPGDEASLAYKFQFERLDEDFEIFDDIVIPQDSYGFHRVSVGGETSRNRPLSVGLEVEGGEFFTGERIQVKPKLEWRPSPHLFLLAEYERNNVFLPEGDFTTDLVRGRVLVQFSPELSWNNLVQYDNVSESIGVNSRLRWIIVPGRDLFIVVNRSFADQDAGIRGRGQPETATETEIAAKLAWTFRF